MDPYVAVEDIKTEFEEVEIPIPSWMQVDNDDVDPLALPSAKIEKFDDPKELKYPQVTKLKIENEPTSTLSDHLRIKIEEEIHIEDYGDIKEFDEHALAALDKGQIKSKEELDSQDVAGDDNNDLDAFSNEYNLTPSTVSIKLSDKQERSETELTNTSEDNVIVNERESTSSGFIEGSYKCNICNFAFHCKNNYNRHLSTHKGDNIISHSDRFKKYTTVTLSWEKMFVCNLCPYRTAYSSNLKQHIITHTGEKRFNCNLCEFKCSQASNLKKHIKTHTGEKKFTCNLCPYKCTQSSNLKRHMCTHTGEKKFNCNICKYSCIEAGTLKRHMFIHTGEKKFNCSLCQFSTAQSGTLKRHMFTHTGKKKFQL